MLRLLIGLSLLTVILDAVPSAASVYVGDGVGRAADPAQPAAAYFPRLRSNGEYGSLVDSAGLATLVAAVNEFFHNDTTEQRPQTVASLYGEVVEKEKTPAAEETATTIPVFVGGPTGDPIEIFTGANTSKILNELFSGILNVNDETFAHRGERTSRQSGVSAGRGGSAGRINTSLGSGGFLTTQTVGAIQEPSQQSWISQNRITQDFPAFEEKKTVKTSDFLKLIFKLLNPYFYGALLLILLFSLAWSMRSRFTQDHDSDH